MGNCALTEYVAVGVKEQLSRLHDTMVSLPSNEIGTLADTINGNRVEFDCRGLLLDFSFINDGLYFSTETPWDEPYLLRHLIEEKFPGLKLYYSCEETMCGIFTTNDAEWRYFPERYYLWVEGGESTYINTLEELIEEVHRITGAEGLDSLVSCENALEDYCEDNDLLFNIAEYEVLDD